MKLTSARLLDELGKRIVLWCVDVQVVGLGKGNSTEESDTDDKLDLHL